MAELELSWGKEVFSILTALGYFLFTFMCSLQVGVHACACVYHGCQDLGKSDFSFYILVSSGINAGRQALRL